MTVETIKHNRRLEYVALCCESCPAEATNRCR